MRRARWLLVLALLPVASGSTGAQEDFTTPSPSYGPEGLKEGPALLIVPGRYSDHGLEETLLPFGFEVHLTPATEPGRELIYPAGVWFQPPEDRYRVWLQGDWRITPHSLLLLFTGKDIRRREMKAVLPVEEAGKVRLDEGVPLRETLHLRLIHAGSYQSSRYELSRTAPTRDVEEGLLMPVGPTLAGLWDETQARYVALSRPFQVAHRETIAAPVEAPSGVAHLVVQLVRATKNSEEVDVGLTLQSRQRATAPDVVISTASSVYGFWYDLPEGDATVTATSATSYLQAVPVTLELGGIERLVGELSSLQPPGESDQERRTTARPRRP